MPSLSDIGVELLRLDPSVVGFVIALFVAALAAVIYLYLRTRSESLWWRLQAGVISTLLSGTIALPLLYLLSNCIGICSL